MLCVSPTVTWNLRMSDSGLPMSPGAAGIAAYRGGSATLRACCLLMRTRFYTVLHCKGRPSARSPVRWALLRHKGIRGSVAALPELIFQKRRGGAVQGLSGMFGGRLYSVAASDKDQPTLTCVARGHDTVVRRSCGWVRLLCGLSCGNSCLMLLSKEAEWQLPGYYVASDRTMFRWDDTGLPVLDYST